MVDDNVENIQLLGNYLKSENYLLGFATSGEQALNLLKEANDFALVLLDVNMPEMNGYEVCRQMRENPNLKDIPVIFLSAYSDVDFIVEGFESGANDYVTKPLKKRELLARISTQLKLKNAENSLKDSIVEKEKLLISEQQLLDKTLKGSIKMLIDILAMISPVDLIPSKKMSHNARYFANKLNIKNVWELEITLLLSRLGCITIPVDIVSAKFRGKALTSTENYLFWEHPQFGKKLLSHIPRFENIGESIAYQYKHFDGSGYPTDEIKGKDIPLFSRILHILNDIEELTNKGNSKHENLRILNARTNWYDPDILKYVDLDMFEEIELDTSSKTSNTKNQAGIVSYIKPTANKQTKQGQKSSTRSTAKSNSNANNESYADAQSNRFIHMKMLSMDISTIRTGMYLAENIENRNGLVILHKHKEITEVIRQSLNNLSTLGTIDNIIKVLVP